MTRTYWTIVTLCAVLGLLSLPAQATTFNEVDGEPIHSQDDVDSNLKTGDTLVLICPTCHGGKMVTYSTDKNSPGHVEWLKPGNTMVCPHCGAKLTAVEKNGNVVYVSDKSSGVGYVTAFKTAKR